MTASPFFCKPFPDIQPQELLFLFTDPDLGGKIGFRSLDLKSDIDTIHRWVNKPYARRYWQMNISRESLIETYVGILANPLAHSFIGQYDGRIICQVDLYHVSADELKDHVPALPGNCGLHILMLPPRESFKGLTESMLKAFIRFYFSFSAAGCLYGEPDARNTAATTAALRAGFKFQRTITMSYKTANLFSITKQQFHATYPILCKGT
jgi:RimJ/RimL family protein N-acetyltransferase